MALDENISYSLTNKPRKKRGRFLQWILLGKRKSSTEQQKCGWARASIYRCCSLKRCGNWNENFPFEARGWSEVSLSTIRMDLNLKSCLSHSFAQSFKLSNYQSGSDGESELIDLHPAFAYHESICISLEQQHEQWQCAHHSLVRWGRRRISFFCIKESERVLKSFFVKWIKADFLCCQFPLHNSSERMR